MSRLVLFSAGNVNPGKHFTINGWFFPFQRTATVLELWMDIAQLLQSAAMAVGGMLMFIFCMFLFIAFIGAAFATLEVALTLVKLPGLLLGLLVEYLLVKTTRLEHFALAGVRCAVGACVFSAIAGGVAVACGVALLPALAVASLGALYGVMSTIGDGLGREFWQPRKSIEPRE